MLLNIFTELISDLHVSLSYHSEFTCLPYALTSTPFLLSLPILFLTSITLSLSLSLSRTHTQTHICAHALFLSHSLSHTNTHSLSHAHTLTHTLSLSYTHTHTHSHTHQLSLSYTPIYVCIYTVARCGGMSHRTEETRIQDPRFRHT